MELKKNHAQDLEGKRPLFFSIGLAIALGSTIFAFNWKSEVDPVIILPTVDMPLDIYIPDITHQEKPEPPKPKMVEVQPVQKVTPNANFVEVDNDVKVLTEIDDPKTIDIDAIVETIDEGAGMPVEVAETAPVDFAEYMPEFPGGTNAFLKFIGKNIKYPRQAKKMNVQGTVYLQYIIDKNGNVTDVTVLRGIGAGCDEEAIRVLKSSPKWKPGRQGSLPVNVRLRVPINFVLN